MNGKTKNLISLYLSTNDILNKYSLKSPYQVPELNKIVFELPLSRFSTSSNKQDIVSSSAKALIIFFFFFGGLPEIVYQKSQSSKIEKIYSFKYTLIKKSLTKTFLERLFLIGFNQTDFENFKLFKKKNTFVQKKNSLNNNLVLSTQILLSKFFEIEDLFKENN